MSYNTINDVGKGYYSSRGSKFYSFIHPIQTHSEHKHLISIYRTNILKHVIYAIHIEYF